METWLLNAGGRVIEKNGCGGLFVAGPLDRLIYCLWAADYGMRNAGDLETAADLHPTCLHDGKSAAQELALPRSAAAFSLSPDELERAYFKLFDEVVSEIRAV
ncbi:hypothetical protein ACOJBO_45740 [Rhizobium beringeri]